MDNIRLTDNPQTLKPSASSDPHHFPKVILIGLAAFLIMIIGGGIGYYLGVNSQVNYTQDVSQSPKENIYPTHTTQPTVIPTVSKSDIKTGWKTYTDSLYDYTIKYPSEWILKQDKDFEGDARIELVAANATALGVTRKAPQIYISITSPFSTSGVAIANTPGGPAEPLEVYINGKQQSIPVTGVGSGKEFDFYTFRFPLPGKKVTTPRFKDPVSLIPTMVSLNVIASYKTVEEAQTISNILSTITY